MATYKVRGTSHNVVYPYVTSLGEKKQQWETYTTELEALQRKAYIDYLQKNGRFDDIRKAAIEYKRNRAIKKSAETIAKRNPDAADSTLLVPEPREENLSRTYREFMEKFLPSYARKQNFSPKTYDSYVSNLNSHILPYFGDWIMSTITAEAIDQFIDALRKKPCKGSKSYGKKLEDVPKLSSSTIKKCYNILMLGFPTAKRWGYITEIPSTTAPSEKFKKRRAWEPMRIMELLDNMKDDPVTHLAVHLGFVCSLRAGEVAGLDINSINLDDSSFWVTQILERVSDDSLDQLPKEKIVRIIPKQISASKSSFVLKAPKTEDSYRKQYLTVPLAKEIKQRLDEIRYNKDFLGPEYQDYGLLICKPDGRPIDPNHLCKALKKWQAKLQITDPIDFQGLRKSGQMHKVRLSQNNYQLVAENSGQSPEVLMSNYNEALESDKRNLSHLVEKDLYPSVDRPNDQPVSVEPELLLQRLRDDPRFAKQLLELLNNSAESAS